MFDLICFDYKIDNHYVLLQLLLLCVRIFDVWNVKYTVVV